uniref:Lcl C-terminal domain-containing protein n=1 Tax=Cysteiniphilum halobium TaxID=2219059 RepID=UPI0013C34715
FSQGTGAEADCVIDNLTGLMWPREDSFTGLSWSDALTAANNYSRCGYTDWRLPNVNELKSLINYGEILNYTWLNGFSINVSPDAYWTSTTRVNNINDAYTVHMQDYYLLTFDKVNLFPHAIPVRGNSNGYLAKVIITGQTSSMPIVAPVGADGDIMAGEPWPITRFVEEGECIIDYLTGLMWPKNGVIGFEDFDNAGPSLQPNYGNVIINLNRLNWHDAIQAINNMNIAAVKLCGYSDWRLPNTNELSSLINYGADISVGPNYNLDWLMMNGFENMTVSFYWTSADWIGGMVRRVSLKQGTINPVLVDNLNYVLPVRSLIYNQESNE